MGITNDQLDLMEIFRDLGNVCQTEAVCQKCASKGCLVGYSKESAAECRIKGKTFVEDGYAQIPPNDIRGGYDEFDVLHTIAHLLIQCRSCKTDHFDNCIINIIRSCMEVIELGEEQIYEGDPISYMVKIGNIDPQKAEIIREEYVLWKEKKFRENIEK